MSEHDDDLLPELPSLGELGEEDPLGDDELGLEDERAGEDENVGLDDAAGLDDESFFALELPPPDEVTDEDDVDAIPVEGLDGDDEHGWTDDARDDEEPWDATELDLPGLTPLSGDDGGEEGVDESALGEVPHLPPLRERVSDEDEDADDLALGEDAMIEERAPAESARELPRLDGSACRVEHLGPAGAIAAFDPGPPSLALGSAGLFSVDARCERLDARGLDGEPTSIASSGARVVIGTRRGALRSDDGGASFVVANGWAGEGRDSAQEIDVRREEGASRVWARSAGGALFRSDDGGASWVGPLLLKTVLAIATPAEGGVIALSGRRGAPLELARSSDGGQRWSALEGPPLGEGACFVDASRECIAVSSDRDPAGPFLSSDRGKSWARVPGLLPTGPMALVWEPGGLSLYAAHFGGDEHAVVVRHRPRGGEAALVLDVAEEAERRGLGASARVLAIRAARAGDETVLHVATGVGLFRVLVDPDRTA